ncbi:AAA family ATPase [Bacillus thuringiensis]|uniref:AAA family ATPase n=1 Tax=Bacillus thuringiensis TaxID=1428 RepID=UPI0026E3FFC0|nr:AAA family ATPase [Bacillus thuringiensis]MDO6631786.1 AAA family ATPase [Bacillus thuringiensis]MDO6661383.1 AAA family ATPase [Bacillus thuringiensis]MDO6701926.1 AAA family ATPase [Bacillus thuringiensis]
MFQVTEAKREKMKAVIGFIGCSGSGKTGSALLTAFGMMQEAYPDLSEEELWKKIGVIDTEHERSKLHVGLVYGEVKIGNFLHINFTPPYTTERYNEAVRAMKKAGAEVIIIDSLSHNWQGEGGIVETHGGMSGNSFQNWGKLAPETTKLIKTLTQNDVHILATLRTKTEYVVESDSNGRMAPRKVGTKPVQKDEMEYEFMLNFVIDIEHVATTSKDNTQMFEGHPQKITADVGRKLYQWLELGIDVKAEEEARRTSLIHQVMEMVNENPEMQIKVQEFEMKANRKLENFTMKLAQTALERLRDFKTKEEK